MPAKDILRRETHLRDADAVGIRSVDRQLTALRLDYALPVRGGQRDRRGRAGNLDHIRVIARDVAEHVFAVEGQAGEPAGVRDRPADGQRERVIAEDRREERGPRLLDVVEDAGGNDAGWPDERSRQRDRKARPLVARRIGEGEIECAGSVEVYVRGEAAVRVDRHGLTVHGEVQARST